MKRVSARGFTFLELMIGLVIMGIMATFAVPQFRGLIKNYRLTNAARVVWLDLHKAKMLAIKRRRTMTVNFTPTSYNVADAGTVAFSRNLSSDYSIITFDTSDTTATVSFGSTGTANGGTVVIQGSTRNKCFTIALTGRIGTISVFNSTTLRCG